MNWLAIRRHTSHSIYNTLGKIQMIEYDKYGNEMTPRPLPRWAALRPGTVDLPAAVCVDTWMHMTSHCRCKYIFLYVLISGIYKLYLMRQLYLMRP